ncbi:ABC transporter ATP-binding protein [Rhizobium leguminosarum]
MTEVLNVSNVTVRFGGLVAVNDASFSVPVGSIFGLIGPNGSGKTTMFNVMTGFYRPAAGQVSLEGTNLVGLRPFQIARKGVARTFQTAVLQPERTVEENVVLGLYCGRKQVWRDVVGSDRKRSDDLEVDGVLELVGIRELRDTAISKVPIGLRHTVELARALATKPKLLLLDEAWAGLNTIESAALMRLVRQVRDSGVTVILVEHNMKIVMEICERIVVLDAGRKIAEGTPAEVRSNPEVIRCYLGGPLEDAHS